MTHCITVSTYSVSSAVSHCSITDIDINVVMDEDDYNVMQNWMKVAEWRQAKREQEEEERVMMRGIQRVRMSGISNREFFQVDRRDEIRQEEQRMKQEQERLKKEEERKKKEEEPEQSQSLLEVEDRNSVTPSQKIKFENFSKKFRNYGKNP